MYREHKNPLFDFVQRRGRERHNLDSLAVERDDVRGMLKLLRSGRAIWYAPDQDYGAKQSIFVPLFGIQAATVHRRPASLRGWVRRWWCRSLRSVWRTAVVIDW